MKNFRYKRTALKYAKTHRGTWSIVQHVKSVKTKKGYKPGKVTGYMLIRR